MDFCCIRRREGLKLLSFLQGVKHVSYPLHYFRYVGIVKSKKNSTLSKYKSTKGLLIVIILITFLFELPLHFEFEVQEVNCQNETVLRREPPDWTENEVYQYLYKSALYPLFRRFLPLMLTSILTYKLVRFLIEKRKVRKTLLSTGLNTENPQNVADIDHLTKVLTTVALVYVACLAPSALYPVIEQFTDVNGEHCDSVLHHFVVISDTLGLINSSVNFFIYYLYVPVFKKCLSEMIPSCHTKRNVREVYVVQITRL